MSGDEHRQSGPILGQIPHLPRSVQMHGSPSCTCLFCWDEIKRLRAEVERLRSALRYIGQPTSSLPGDADAVQYVLVADERAVRLALQTCIRMAREALAVQEACRER